MYIIFNGDYFESTKYIIKINILQFINHFGVLFCQNVHIHKVANTYKMLSEN